MPFIINDGYVLFITLILAFPHAHDNLLQEFCWLQAYQTSPGTVKADAVPELCPAQRPDESLALGLCVFMKVRIFFSTQILPDIQRSSTL